MGATLGAATGCGLVLVLLGLRTTRSTLGDVVLRYEADAHLGLVADGRPESPRSARPLLTRVGRFIDSLALRVGKPLMRVEDLALLERDPGHQLAAVGMAAVGLGAGGVFAAAAVSAVGLSLPPYSSAVGALLGVTAGTMLVAHDLRRTAERERSAFLRALGSWLDLVAMGQAGGMGVESALQAACTVTDDPSFRRLRLALDQSAVAGTVPWVALGRLGRRIGITELEELASTLSLAGAEGARVRATLVAKSSSLRRRQLSQAQAEANATTEKLFLPSIVLMVAFMIFLMYPAGVRLAHIF